MGNDSYRSDPGKRHPLDDAFRNKVRLQIYLPILLGVIGQVILVASIWTTGQGTESVWADVSLMMLIIPAFIMGLILLVLLGVLAYGVAYVIGVLPEPFRRLQEILTQISVSVEKASNLAAKPIILPRAVGAAVEAAFKGIRSIFTRNPK